MITSMIYMYLSANDLRQAQLFYLQKMKYEWLDRMHRYYQDIIQG